MDITCNIKQVLLTYKNATLSIIDEIMKDTDSPLTELWETREKCVHEMSNSDISKEDFRCAVTELQILETDEKLRVAIESKKANLINSIHRLATKNTGVMAYKKMQKNDIINRLEKL